MKTPLAAKFFIASFFMAISHLVQAQKPVNWTPEQLMQPETLAAMLGTKAAPLVFSVGPSAIIPNSVDVGMAVEPKNLDALKAQLNKYPKNSAIVVYCGCCPFDHCPNVRPAIALLKEMKFTNYYLLNLPHNIKQDWIDKNYPTNE